MLVGSNSQTQQSPPFTPRLGLGLRLGGFGLRLGLRLHIAPERTEKELLQELGWLAAGEVPSSGGPMFQANGLKL